MSRRTENENYEDQDLETNELSNDAIEKMLERIKDLQPGETVVFEFSKKGDAVRARESIRKRLYNYLKKER